MAIYYSHLGQLRLLRKDGVAAYQFDNGVLIVGDQTTESGASNLIDPNLAATDGTALQPLYPSAATDEEKVGKGYTFWRTHAFTNATAIVVGQYYRVVSGTVVHATVTYHQGERFKATATSFTGSGLLRDDLSASYYSPNELNEREESFRKAHLGQGDEATWDDQNLESVETAVGTVR